VANLYGKRAVITGAASGLGRSLATALAAEGWKVGIVDINDAGAEETLAITPTWLSLRT
jgi:NAD(P)-dependent dehydrogenase (short-subunit alcohol dehydrogenase family)